MPSDLDPIDNMKEQVVRFRSAINALDSAVDIAFAAKAAWIVGNYREAIKGFGVAHEDMREVSVFARRLPDDLRVSILEDQPYTDILEVLGDLEGHLARECEARLAAEVEKPNGFFPFAPFRLPPLPKPPWANGS